MLHERYCFINAVNVTGGKTVILHVILNDIIHKHNPCNITSFFTHNLRSLAHSNCANLFYSVSTSLLLACCVKTHFVFKTFHLLPFWHSRVALKGP